MGVTLASIGGGFNPSSQQQAMGVTAFDSWQFHLFLLNLPSTINPNQVTYPPAPGALPESPLAGPVAIGAENVVLGAAAALATLGYRSTLQVLDLARKAVIYSGHPGFDASFWALYLRSPELQRLIGQASSEVLSVPIPQTSPVRQSGILQRQLYGFPDQEELDRLFLLGQGGDLARIEAQLAALRANPLYGLSVDEPNSPGRAVQQRIDSLQAGLALRPLIQLRFEIAQGRYDLVRALLGLLFTEPAGPGLPAMPIRSVDP